jgi:hypothetical protein
MVDMVRVRRKWNPQKEHRRNLSAVKLEHDLMRSGYHRVDKQKFDSPRRAVEVAQVTLAANPCAHAVDITLNLRGARQGARRVLLEVLRGQISWQTALKTSE